MITTRIYKKKVKPYGARGAHVTLPTECLGKTVYVLFEDTKNELEELINNTLLIRKLDILERKEFSRKFEEFKNEVGERLLRLERVVFQ